MIVYLQASSRGLIKPNTLRVWSGNNWWGASWWPGPHLQWRKP